MSKASSLTRRQKVVEKEQSIIAATRTVFREHGAENVKISEIANLAGLAEGTVYLYFKNKKALLLAVANDFYEDLTRDAAEGIKKFSDTSNRLEFLARHHFERVSEEWPMIALAMSPYQGSNEYRATEGYQLNRRYVEVFDQVMREGVNRGEIRDDLPLNMIRDIFYGGLEYGARTMRLRDKDVDLDKAVGDFISILSAGIFVPANPGGTAKISDGMETVLKRLEKVASKIEFGT